MNFYPAATALVEDRPSPLRFSDIVFRKSRLTRKAPLRRFMKDDIERRFRQRHSCDGLFIGNVAVDTADFVGQLRKGPFRKVIRP